MDAVLKVAIKPLECSFLITNLDACHSKRCLHLTLVQETVITRVSLLENPVHTLVRVIAGHYSNASRLVFLNYLPIGL